MIDESENNISVKNLVTQLVFLIELLQLLG